MAPRLFVALAAFSLASCNVAGPAPGVKSPARTPGGPNPKDVGVTPGLTLVTACTPTGPELCFDATDNNCNGVIDEGCGVHTGALQFAIAWGEGPDVDLTVIDPEGELARPGEATSSGLHKDRDCGTKENLCRGQNMENVYFEGDAPPAGPYQVKIAIEQANGATFPVEVRFAGRVGAHTYAMQLVFAAADEQKVFQFRL